MTRQLAVQNPRTGETDLQISALDRSDLATAAGEARSAQSAWQASGLEHRCTVVQSWAKRLLAAPEAVIDALTTDTGRHLVSQLEVRALGGIVDRWVAAAPTLLGDQSQRSTLTDGVSVRGQLIPYSLVGVISPWNFPFLLSMLDSIPALIAGCAVIVKPSEVTPRFIQPLRASLSTSPELASVFRWVEGDGATGAALVDQVDALAFTGSVTTGLIVAEACARNFIPAFLELGGKDPAIILPDADPEQAARVVLRASVQATGQACQSLERIYVHESILEDFVDCLVEAANRVELNWPDLHQGHIGPLIFAQQAKVIADHLADARAKGAIVLTGGVIEEHDGGKWVRPTVVTNVDHTMKLMREETFGPVIPVMPYRTVEQAVDYANDTRYGLSAAVIGPDVEQAVEVAQRINAGAVSINDGGLTTEVHDVTHDSFLHSGIGAARMGSSGITRFLRRKALLIRHTEALGIDSLDERRAGRIDER